MDDSDGNVKQQVHISYGVAQFSSHIPFSFKNTKQV
jgi:hypothetical protein